MLDVLHILGFSVFDWSNPTGKALFLFSDEDSEVQGGQYLPQVIVLGGASQGRATV